MLSTLNLMEGGDTMGRVNMELKFQIFRRFGSQADFAEAVGVRDELVSRVVRGRRAISEDEMARWSKILGVDVRSLIVNQVKIKS